MRENFCLILLLALAQVIGISARANAGDCRCAHCGCAECQKVCRLVCEEKKVDVTCWGCQREDFCVPGHSKPGCKHCEIVCESCDAHCDSDGPSSAPQKFVWREWIPGCAHVHTKNKLVKKTVTKTVPSYKWVVEDLCSQCEAKSEYAQIEPGAAVPPPPVVDAKLRYGIKAAAGAPLVDNKHPLPPQIAPVSSQGQATWPFNRPINKQ